MILILSKDVTVDTPHTHFDLYYDVTARTKTSITLKFTVKGKLIGGSILGQGSTFGINGYVKILGKEYYIKVKGTTSSDIWRINNTYIATASHTISGIKGIDTKITGVTYRQTRTGSKDDGKYINAAEFNHVACSDIIFNSYPVNVKIKKDDVYKSGNVFFKKNDEWTNNGIALFLKVNDSWKEI
jgi:hypothetical protein